MSKHTQIINYGTVLVIIFGIVTVGSMIGLLGSVITSPDMYINLATDNIEYTNNSITFGINNDYTKTIELYGVNLKIYGDVIYCEFNSTKPTIDCNEIIFITATHNLNISETDFPYYELRVSFIKGMRIKTALIVRTNYWLELEN